MTSNGGSHSAGYPALGTWLAFAALCVGMFMAVLDIQIVATSLPTIQSALNIRPDQMSWIQTSYLIAEVVAIPLTGLLTRALTTRWLAAATLLIFTLASLGCALSGSFETLLLWRIIQGFAGGLLIPQVFSAGFVLFPGKGQAAATTIAGVLAVLAPAVGPYIGGWITSTFDWRWLFLVNIAPGIIAIAAVTAFLPRNQPELRLLRNMDLPALIWMAVALACLEIGLKEAPQNGWLSATVVALIGSSMVAGALFIARTLASKEPLVQLRMFRDQNFMLGSALSFILGVGLYGSVYLMPVFLAYVRNHDAVEIGEIMIVTGAAQLVMAPLAVYLEHRMSARILTAAGFSLFAFGLALSAFQTRATDFDEMLLPQIVRGIAIMLCLLPPIRLALGHMPPEAVADASGLFNLMRNLGGAIGLALIDTIIYGRTPIIAERLGQAIVQGDAEAAKTVGLPMERFLSHTPGAAVDPSVESYVRSAVERQAMVEAINEAWAMMAILTIAGALAVWIVRSRIRSQKSQPREAAQS